MTLELRVSGDADSYLRGATHQRHARLELIAAKSGDLPPRSRSASPLLVIHLLRPLFGYEP